MCCKRIVYMSRKVYDYILQGSLHITMDVILTGRTRQPPFPPPPPPFPLSSVSEFEKTLKLRFSFSMTSQPSSLRSKRSRTFLAKGKPTNLSTSARELKRSHADLDRFLSFAKNAQERMLRSLTIHRLLNWPSSRIRLLSVFV